MNELALFAGGGGGILGGVLLGWRTVCAVEIDPYCRRVLMQRQNDGVLPAFPIWDDVRTFDGRAWRGKVDVVTAGFPCQPFSLAGQRRGEDDERNMWPDTLRCLCEIRPRYALLENVPGLLVHDYFGTILGDLAEGGYGARWGVLSAAGLGAPHIRKRLWILAHAKDEVQRTFAGSNSGGRAAGERETQAGRVCVGLWSSNDARLADTGAYVAHAHQSGLEVGEGEPRNDGPERQTVERGGWWTSEPDVGRVAYGVASRMDRIRALGNGQVPAVAAAAWLRLIGVQS